MCFGQAAGPHVCVAVSGFLVVLHLEARLLSVFSAVTAAVSREEDLVAECISCESG